MIKKKMQDGGNTRKKARLEKRSARVMTKAKKTYKEAEGAKQDAMKSGMASDVQGANQLFSRAERQGNRAKKIRAKAATLKSGGSTSMKKYAAGGMTTKKKMKAGSTTRTCPSGFTLVDGKCVDMSGKEASYPYIAPSGAMYTNRANMVAGKPTNPLSTEGRKAMEGVDRKTLTRDQMKALGIRKAGGSTPMAKKKLGGVTAKKKMQAGGASKMSTGTKQCGPGDGSCKEVRSGNIFQRLGDKMRRKKSSNFSKPKLRRTKV